MALPMLRWLPVLALISGLLPWAALAAGLENGAPVDVRQWLARIHAAASGRNYQGTMVFTTGGMVSSSRVAHYCVGNQAFERIEALDGKRRNVYRHNDVVHTVWPQAGVAVIERRGAQSGLLSTMQSVEPRALDRYELRPEGQERVAGREAVVLLLNPRDELRFAQRIWADRETGLMLRTEVIGPGRAVLESSGFSEVDIGVPAQPESVLQPIRQLDGLRVLRPVQVATHLAAEGWTLSQPVSGFRLTGCIKRPLSAARDPEASGSDRDVVQAIFSDGLTHVSLFIEPFDPQRHRKNLLAQFGATHTLTLRRGEHWWITAVGDVPPTTLRLFTDALERLRQ